MKRDTKRQEFIPLGESLNTERYIYTKRTNIFYLSQYNEENGNIVKSCI